MDFYQSISKYYHHIFPLNKMQISFIENSHSKPSSALSVLDIGCAIGDLSLELANSYQKVTGIDLDKGMIDQAIEKGKNMKHLSFCLQNMLELETAFGKEAFDTIACFGNTLVHLNSEEEILLFFKNAKSVLKEEGKLLFQIINYDRIIDQNINHLPTIENDTIRFERNYTYHPEKGKVDFETILTIKESNSKIKNCIELMAIKKSTLTQMLQNAGFNHISFYGNFKREPLTENSMPLIVEAY
ncbi:class I SAM-dependent methyltransferase [Marinifilum caeruleilacunae]|uniref:Class I SAM-dependent methyltransferase n=1 Tax=Marinifilum caeruleilacunae TaxID=2499076 RepID=A0ABX1WXD5_9BACT|nr:class I SAM-dependent methyltransferase [Marinifilum caeruleilacunae]NOU60744.1 class I SAM-dependent methyltransferase [Marinifilum caeruleilacunae]